MTDDELIDGIIDTIHEVYELPFSGQIRVSFLIPGTVFSIPLDEGIDSPFWRAIQAILRKHRAQLIHKYLNE